MKILLHICCSNCLIYPYQTLKSEGYEIKGYWFNPNIHPYSEYKARLQSLRQLQRLWGLDIHYDDYYGLREFLAEVALDPDNRCSYCYYVRLQASAKLAKKLSIPIFTTTLLVSPFQNIELIKTVGHAFAEQFGLQFLDKDFRTGFYQARKIAKDLALYSQKYCGCIYSEMDRAMPKTKHNP